MISEIECQNCGKTFDPTECGNQLDDYCPNCVDNHLYGKSFRLERDFYREESAGR